MRKQTKIVAVASAAALLAIGASMTSFAAYGWVQEDDGTWYYYDRDGSRVSDVWRRSGDNWYWLSSEEDGAMAVDTLVEDDDDTYYVDTNGVMVRNTWVKVVNEEQDDDDDPAEYHYYYMQSNGKAIKTNSETTKFKTIDGKRYAFDEDGVMLYGWVDSDHNRVDSEDGWADEGLYYLGNWDDGAMKTGWQKIYVQDNDDDEEKEFWFYFKSNGQKRTLTASDADDGKAFSEFTINGRKYGFDERGVMVYEWAVTSNSDAGAASVSNWKYFSNPEDGARKTKGWFKVVPPEEDNDNLFRADNGEREGVSFAWDDANEENERWYYADGKGQLYEGAIKRINGKYYGFRPDGDDANTDARGGAMLTGLVFLQVDDEGNILNVWDDEVDGDELDDIVNKDKAAEMYTGFDSKNSTLYYFGDPESEDTDGAMRTGIVTINVDGTNYTFQFSKTGGADGKGRGLTGIDDMKYIYKYGMRITAGSDDKYRVVKVVGVNGSRDIHTEGVKVTKIDSQDLRARANPMGKNKDGETVRGVVDLKGTSITGQVWNTDYFLINSSGSISKKKTAARDGDDWYFYVNGDRDIVMYTNIKNMGTKDEYGHDLDDYDHWDRWSAGENETNVFDPLS